MEMFNWTRCGLITVNTTFGRSMRTSLTRDFKRAGIDDGPGSFNPSVAVGSSEQEITDALEIIMDKGTRSKFLFVLRVIIALEK